MPARTIAVESIGDVVFYRRKASRSVRVRVDAQGRVTVTYPWFMSSRAAVQFVRTHEEWIIAEKARRVFQLTDGMLIGRVHKLRFVHDPVSKQPRARVTASQIIVTSRDPFDSPTAQAAAHDGAVRALKREAKHFLPKRLADIATAEGYAYESASVRQLKGRWGSCTSKQHITLNCYLMQLPIELIDYVIYHELAHTRAMNHGADFWSELETHLPNARELRKQMKLFQPSIPPRCVA